MELQANNNQDYEKNLKEEDLNYDVQASMRLGFIRKVYGILSAQLFMTVVMAAFTFFQGYREFLLGNIWLFWVCMILSILVIIPLICFKDLARTSPNNYILTFIWTFCEGYMVSTVCAFYEYKTVLLAAFLTAAITITLTVYAYRTNTDFTFMGGMLYCAIVLLFFLSIFSIFFSFMRTLYCVLGVLVYSIYLIYDTQLLMGKFGNEYQIDDYIIASIMIYIDIIQIFLYLLELFGERRS